MLADRTARWGLTVLASVLVAGGLLTRWWSATPGEALLIEPQLLTELARRPAEECSPLLTTIEDGLASGQDVCQVLLLQAVPHEAPQIVATALSSSDDEGATHWPSPWEAVNTELESGRLERPVSVSGTHAGYRYRHDLIPVDETHTRIVLINQSAPAPQFSVRRLLAIGAGLLLLIVLWLSRS